MKCRLPAMASRGRSKAWHTVLPAISFLLFSMLQLSTALPSDLVCSIAIKGGNSESNNTRVLSTLAVNCTIDSLTHDAQRASILFRDGLVGVEGSLQDSLRSSLQGIDLEFSAAAPSLVSISYPGNIMITDSQLTSIRAWELDYLLNVSSKTGTVTIDGLSATDCGASIAILYSRDEEQQPTVTSRNSIIVQSSNFTNCRCSLLSLSARKVSIDQCSFLNNAWDSSSVYEEYGMRKDLGSAVMFTGNAEISRSSFHNNSAGFSSSQGGAVMYNTSTHSSSAITTLYVTSSNFTLNTAAAGGALYIGSQCSSNITDSVFLHNSAAAVQPTDLRVIQRGGALCFFGQSLNVTGSSFMGNIASESGDFLTTEGGAIYGDIGAVFIANTTFCNNTSSGDGGAVACRWSSQLQVVGGTVFWHNTAEGSGGGLHSFNVQLVELTYSTWHSNRAGVDGGAIALRYHAQKPVAPNTVIVACNVTNNTAQSEGGGLQVRAGVTSLINNVFTQNRASMGGAVYFARGTVPFHRLGSAGDTYTHNSAHTGGALYFSDPIELRCFNGSTALLTDELLDALKRCPSGMWVGNSVTVSENGTSYGPMLAGPPANLTFNDPQPNLTHYVSDGRALPPMVVNVTDVLGTLVTTDLGVWIHVELYWSKDDWQAKLDGGLLNLDSSSCNLPKPELEALWGRTDVRVEAGSANFSNLVLSAAPGKTCYLAFHLLAPQKGYKALPLGVQVTFVACPSGWVQQDSAAQECLRCPASQYSFLTNSVPSLVERGCDTPCPANANCTGGAVMVPLEGHWVSAVESDSIVTCPNSEACQGSRTQMVECLKQAYGPGEGGAVEPNPMCTLETVRIQGNNNSYLPLQCTDGYMGPACSVCHQSGPDPYGRVNTLGCAACKPAGWIVFAYIASTVLVLLLLCYTIHVSLLENMEEANDSVRASELLKALTLWLQYIALIGQTDIPAPDTLHAIFTAASFAFSSLTSGLLSTDCLMSASAQGNLAFRRLLLQLAAPLIGLAVLVVIQVCVWWGAKQQAVPPTPTGTVQNLQPVPQNNRAELQRRLLVTVLTVIFYYYPSVLTTTLSLFLCYPLDSFSINAKYPHNAQGFPGMEASQSRGYWVPDMRVSCWMGWHIRHAVPLGVVLLVVCIAVAVLPVTLLFKHRKQLTRDRIRFRFGFIVRPYQPEYWFWDSITLWQTFFLVLAQVFATAKGTLIQLTSMLVILVVGHTIVLHLRPLGAPQSQAAQASGLFTVVLTIIGCLYLVYPSQHAATNSAGQSPISILILILNASFVVVMVIGIGRAGRHELFSALKWLRGKVEQVVNGLMAALNMCLRGMQRVAGGRN